METPTTVHSLDDDSLGVLIGCFPPKQRANTISLVCKTWQRVEREHAYRPKALNMRPQDMTAAFLTWHCRDTSRLKAVRVSGNAYQVVASDSYCEGMPRMLRHLHAWAPSLRILELVPPAPTRPGVDEYSSASTEFLPLVGVLSRLEHLALRQWEYTAADFAALCHLTQLQNLEALELSELSLKVEANTGIESVELYNWAFSAHDLQTTLQSLQLTSLSLRAIDFLTSYALVCVPVKEVGSLTNLRSLSYECDEFPEEARFPYIDKLTNLTRLELIADSEEDEQRDMFAPLIGLKELMVSSHRDFQPLVLASAAEVTKLTVEGNLGTKMPLGTELPFETLKHVKSLAMKCHTPNEALDWSAAWGELTNLTRLALQIVEHGVSGSPQHILPNSLPKAICLREIELTTGFKIFDRADEPFFVHLTGNFPLLTLLQIEVREIPEADNARLDDTCNSLSLRMPNWVYGFHEVDAAGDMVTRIVTFKLQVRQ